jgi:glutamyl-tRNA synthetase
MGEGNKKLSKRDPESNLFHHKDRGFIPEGLLNYLALLGWGISADEDIFSLSEMAKAFDVVDVNPNPARFDLKKAEAINATHIRQLAPEDFQSRLVPYLQAGNVLSNPATDAELAILSKAAPLIQERITLLGESVDMLSFLFVPSSKIEIEEDAKKALPENAKAIVTAALEALQGLESFTTDALHDLMNQVLVESMGEKPRNAFGPLRTAISGKRVSPPLFESMEILGKAETLARLELFARG